MPRRIRSRKEGRLARLDLSSPAKSLEQNVVAFRAKLESSEKTHRRVATLLVVLEQDGVQVLDGDPPEDGARFFDVGCTSGYKLAHLEQMPNKF